MRIKTSFLPDTSLWRRLKGCLAIRGGRPIFRPVIAGQRTTGFGVMGAGLRGIRLALAVILYCCFIITAARAMDISGLETVEGTAIFHLTVSWEKPLVLVFMSVECPIANKYVPTLKRLAEEQKHARLVLVYPNTDETANAIEKHVRDYGLGMEVWRDTRHALVRMTGARVTPEAVVMVEGGKIIYRGRIDDRFEDWGKSRPAARKEDLREVLEMVGKGEKVEARQTEAVGCYIAGVK